MKKYVWVAFNLLSSVGILVWLAADMDKESAAKPDPTLGLVLLLAFIGLGYWIYRSILYWRKCVEFDDPVFKQVVDSLSDKD